jgi:hypothetical protein
VEERFSSLAKSNPLVDPETGEVPPSRTPNALQIGQKVEVAMFLPSDQSCLFCE